MPVMVSCRCVAHDWVLLSIWGSGVAGIRSTKEIRPSDDCWRALGQARGRLRLFDRLGQRALHSVVERAVKLLDTGAVDYPAIAAGTRCCGPVLADARGLVSAPE